MRHVLPCSTLAQQVQDNLTSRGKGKYILSCEGGELGFRLVRFAYSEAVQQLDGYDTQDLVELRSELGPVVEPCGPSGLSDLVSLRLRNFVRFVAKRVQ